MFGDGWEYLAIIIGRKPFDVQSIHCLPYGYYDCV